MSVEGLRSKSWDEFGAANAPHMDFVITVCDQAASEVCPIWPGRPTTTHWSVPDPAGTVLPGEDRRKLFFDAFITLRRRIELLASLPLDKLSGLALQERLDEIAQVGARAVEAGSSRFSVRVHLRFSSRFAVGINAEEQPERVLAFDRHRHEAQLNKQSRLERDVA